MKYIIGIDVGGMSAKFALFAEDGEKIYYDRIPTKKEDSIEFTVEKFNNFIDEILNKNNINREDVKAIGIGIPGIIDSKNGIVISWTVMPLLLENQHLEQLKTTKVVYY